MRLLCGRSRGRLMYRATLSLLVSLCVCSFVRAEVPTINALNPSGAQRGQTVTVQVEGKLGTAPLTLWSDRAGVTATFPEKLESEFQITVAAEEQPGIAWLRLYNAEGASSLRPFVIGTIPELKEDETNDSLEKAQAIAETPTVVNGLLRKNGDVDCYAVELKTGETLVCSLLSNEVFSSPLDGVLQIVSPQGFVLEQNDDDRGNDPLIAFTAPADGRYVVRVFGFPAAPDSGIRFSGGATYLYRLTLTTGPYVDRVQPLMLQANQDREVELHGWNLPEDLRRRTVPAGALGETKLIVDERIANATTIAVGDYPSYVETQLASTDPLALPAVVSGVIAVPDEIDTIRVQGVKGEAIQFKADARGLGSQLDPVLRLTDTDGNQLAEADDASRSDFDCLLNFTPKADGELRLQITDRFQHGTWRHYYRVTMAAPRPEVSLSVEADQFTITDDKPLEIPVTINRSGGFNSEIEVTVDPPIEGVTVEPAKSEGKGDSSKKVTLKLTRAGDATYVGPLKIVGRVKDDAETVKPVEGPAPGTNTKSTALWLTVPVKK